MSFKSLRASLDSKEGLAHRANSSANPPPGTSRRRRSSYSQRIKDSARRVRKRYSDAKDRFNSYEPPEHDITGSESELRHRGLSGEEESAASTGVGKRLSNAFNNYRPPVSDFPRIHGNTDSGSERMSGGSSGDEGSIASTAPSSFGSQTPATSSFPSRAVSPAPGTFSGTDTNTKKKKVRIPDEYEQKEKWSAFDALPPEEKIELINKPLSPELQALIKADQYQAQIALNNARSKYNSEHPAIPATEESKKTKVLPPLDIYSVIAEANTVQKEVSEALTRNEGAITKDVNKFTCLLLPERLSKYAGSLKDLQWPEGWRDKLKPPSDDKITGLLRGKEEKKLYEDWWVRTEKHTLKDQNGKELPDAEVRDFFRKNCRKQTVTLKRSDPICSQLTNFRKFATTTAPPEFDKLTEKELERVKEMKAIADKTTEGGGTEAEVKKALDEAFGPNVTTGPRHVFFPNAAGTMTGTMEDGTVVTMTDKTSSPATEQFAFDTSAPNPFILDDLDGKIQKEWDDIKAASTAIAKEVEAETAAEQEAMTKAVAKRQARLKPLPPKDGVTDLLSASTKAASDTSSSKTPVSWNQYNPMEWQSCGRPVTADNAAQALDRLLTQFKVDHLMRNKFPALDEVTSYLISTAIADSTLDKTSERVQKQAQKVLGERGCALTDEELSTLWKSKDRPKDHLERDLRTWASRPSGRPGTAEPVSDQAACQRLMQLKAIQSMIPAQSRVKSFKTSSWMVDQISGAESEADASTKASAAMSKIKKCLEENPDWAPDANTTIDG